MQDFRKLDVWAVAHAVALTAYATTKSFPDFEKFGLGSQLRRAASSIAINIAESCGVGTDRDRARFLTIAIASACEAEYELVLARDLGYLMDAEYEQLLTEVQRTKRMLSSLIRNLRSSRPKTAATLR